MGAPAAIAGDRAAAVDGAALAALLAAMALGAQHPEALLAAVAALLAARTIAWHRLVPAAERGPVALELALLALATAAGAANDWNTVVVHGVYDYLVPHGLDRARAVPPWMLLAWGLILRALITLARWRRLDPPQRPDDRVAGHRHPRLRVALLLALVAATRLAIYRWYADPLLSWLPLAAALAVHAGLLGWSRHALRLAALVIAGGTLVEALLIQGIGLHRYALGWLGGVPLWIALWWGLGTLVWCELTSRLLDRGQVDRAAVPGS
jgi:hypothetical protein